MSCTSPAEVEVPVVASSKKQRSARNSGKKGWTPAVSEIRRLVGCSYSTNDGFSPHRLVWAKLDGALWWPARVVSVDEIPEDLKKQEEGWTCVKYFGVTSTQAFAWLKAEELSTYEKNSGEFCQQSIPDKFDVGDFKAALIEIQEIADGRKVNAMSKASSGTTKHQESKIQPVFSSHNQEEDFIIKDGAHIGDVIEQRLKRRKLKFKDVDRRPVTNDNLNLESKGKEALKDFKVQYRAMEMKSKRKRILKLQQTESGGDGVPTGEYLESPNKKFGSPTGNSSSLSSRDLVKKARGKKTGADGYYFECMVCDMGGDLVCCDLCPRVYHLECLNPPLKRTPPGKWICPVCRDTSGAVKAVGAQTPDSKPRFKITKETEATAVVPAPKMRPGPKRGWKLFHKGKQLTQDLDLRKLRKRKREEESERPRKKLNLKSNRAFSSQTQPKCRQCGASINCSGESPSNVFCKECVELVKKRKLNPTGRAFLPRTNLVPPRHSKLKPGRCDTCSKAGLVISCDVCPRGFHKDCLNPPRKRAPKGAWSCPKCGPVKEVREGKDAREAQEGRDAAKEVNVSKTVSAVVKVPKVVKDIQQGQEERQWQTTASPAPLEVDRILGCRVSLTTQSTSKVVAPVGCGICSNGKAFVTFEEVPKSQPGNCTPAAQFDEDKAIEIILPIIETEHSEQHLHVNCEPDEAASAPASDATIEIILPTGEDRSAANLSSVVKSVDLGIDITLPPVEDRSAADLSSVAKSVDLGFALGVVNDLPSQLENCSRGRETQSEIKPANLFNLYGRDHKSRILKDGPEMSIILDVSSSKEESRTVAPSSTTTETGLESRDSNHAEMPGVNNVLELAFSGTKGGDSDSRSYLELIGGVQNFSFLDAIHLPVSEAVCGKESKDLLLNTAEMAEAIDKHVLNKPLDSTVLPREWEFLVKWTGRSHLHNEWVSEGLLRGIAKRKLENFKLKHGSAPKILVEDQWVKPQRIVAKRTQVGKGVEVFVKWSGLSYEECTWEHMDHPVIVRDAELIEAFERFEQEALSLGAELLAKDEDILDPLCLKGQRPTEIETIQEQPAYLKGGSLFPHQLEALNWLRKCWHRQRSVILADEMGLGKTISACSFIASLRHEFKVRAPCLVLVPLSTMPNWLAEFALWAPSLNVIEYHGCAKARTLIRDYEWHADALDGACKKTTHMLKFNVMLTTYEMVIADSSQLRAVPWEVLVVDEGHRLKNSSSKLFTLLNTFSFSHRVLLTGTPLQNNLGEMFNLLNFLQPETFPSLAAFQDKFSSLSTAEQVEELKKLVAPNMLRRLKKDAMQKIPPKTELVVPVDMNSVQIEYYKALLTRNYQVLRNGGKQQSMLNIVMQLRKVCNHPYLITGTEPDAGTPEFLQGMRIKASAKLMLLHSMLGKLKADGHRVLIFSQMTKLLDILEDYLSFEYGQEAFERVDGSVSIAERQAAIARFNQDTSRFVFLLSTRACGLGINLATADTVIIYDSDFNPQADIQAMNRAHRIGQSKTLLVYRLVVRASVEERILQLAKKKLMLDHLLANKSGSQKEVDDILRWGTEELFQETAIPTNEPGSVLGIAGTLDDGDAKQKKKGGELGDLYGGYYLQLGRSKVVWDDAAVKRLLDRSDLSTCHPEVIQGEQESDILGSLKAWDWNDQDAVPEEHNGDDALRKESDAERPSKTPALEEENQWDKLLRSRWETLQTDEEAALGRGKRNRKAVSYMESNGLKSKEPLSESSDAEKEDDPEHGYTPVGRALKQKLAKLRARQKYRILQRYNVAVGPVDGEKLVAVTGMAPESMGLLKKSVIMQDAPSASRLNSQPLPSGRVSADLVFKADLNGNSCTSSRGLVNVSQSAEQQPLHRRSSSPSLPAPNVEWHRKSKSYIPQYSPTRGLPTQMDEVGETSKFSGNNDGQIMWLAGVAPVIQSSSSVISQLSGKPVAPGDESHVEGVSTVSLSTVSQGLERGQSLSQIIPALRETLQGVQYGIILQPSAPMQLGLRGPMSPAVDVVSNKQESGFKGFRTSRPANGSKATFDLEEMKGFSGQQYNSKLPDVAFEFSKRIFGGEKTLSTGDTLSPGEDLLGQQRTQGTILPSAILSGEVMSSLKLQRVEYAPGVALQLPTQGPRVPSLSIALGLQFVDSSPTADALAGQDTWSGTVLPPSAPLSTVVSVKSNDMQGHGGTLCGNSLCHKLGTKDMMPIELNDDEPDPIVSTQRFLSPLAVDGDMGRGWHTEEQRKRRDQANREWTEDELDALWTGVRRHGHGNWAEMLLDSKLCFLKSRSVGELAERWKEEQMKMFGNPEQSSEAGKQPPNSCSSANAVPGTQGGAGRAFSHTSGTELGKALHTHVLLTPNCNGESAVVHPDDRFSHQLCYQEKKETVLWGPSDLETNSSIERLPYIGASKAGGPTTLSGLQVVNKIGELGRLESSRQGLNYHNLFDLQSGRSSPSIPTSIPGRSTSTPGTIPGTNLESFGPSSEAIGRFKDSSIFMTAGTALDQIGGGLGSGLSGGLGLSAEWRRQEARERSTWHQQLPSFPAADSGKHQSSFSERNSGLRSQETRSNVQIPLAPSPRLGSPTGHSLGNKALVSLPNSVGVISTAEHRRRARAGPNAKAMSTTSADDSPPSSLPHWLREAVKARSTPPQPPLPPAIAAVVQATSMLYKDKKRLLPPLVHPGYPMVPPREFPKKVGRKLRRQKIGLQPPLSKTESLMVGNPSASIDFSHSIKVEGLSQPLLPLPPLNGGAAVSSRSVPALGQVSSSLPWSKGLPEFPLLPGLDHSLRQQTTNIPADSLSELAPSRRSIIELGIRAGLHPSIVSAFDLDEPNTRSSSFGKSSRPWPDLGPASGRVWKTSELLSSSLLPPTSGLLTSERLLSRSSEGVALSEALPVGRMGEGLFSDPEKKSQLPQWLLSGDAVTMGSDGGQRHQPNVDARDEDDESTSSKTVSDPGLRSKCGRDDDNSDDASSEETISDDGTQ